jgi:hypothetical protein
MIEETRLPSDGTFIAHVMLETADHGRDSRPGRDSGDEMKMIRHRHE